MAAAEEVGAKRGVEERGSEVAGVEPAIAEFTQQQQQLRLCLIRSNIYLLNLYAAT